MGYLDDLIGIKTVLQGSTAMPQRAAISFEGPGVTVADDPVRGQLVVTFAQDGAAAVEFVTYQGELELEGIALWYANPTGIEDADVVRVNTAAGPYTLETQLTGIAVEGLAQRRKVLVNVGNDALTLVHDSPDVPDDDARFVLTSDVLMLVPNASVEVIWLPTAGSSPAGWRVIGAGVIPDPE